ncbi:MAG: hypothetical protein KDB50_16620 [Mycobacterium sp.]|nr:hypothetical protein [Mycobacterium sp.]
MHAIAWPFIAAEALEAGTLTFRELRRFHQAVYPGVWVPRGADLTPVHRARAAWLWSRRRGVLAGLSASALHGARWVEAERPAELIHDNRRPPPHAIVRGGRLLEGESDRVDGMPVTTVARTAFDLGRWLTVAEAVPRIDALMNATGITVEQIAAVAAAHPGARGLRTLNDALSLADGGAESPYESMTRMLLVQNGFPRPQTQVQVRDRHGVVVARLDMGWRQWRVGVDFEGAHHWTDPRQRSRDIERYAMLPELGWTDIRLTSGMLHNAPRRFLERVGSALIARGCARTW